MPLDPSRTVAELRELQQLTGDENGAQRVAWTDTWERARGWLREKVAETGAKVDANGVALPDAVSAHGVDLDRALDARSELESAVAYLELHIEQGPVLESMDLPLGVVLGTFGVERHLVTFRGQAAHAGSTPMDKRRDALAGAAKLELEIREIAKRTGGGAVCTMGGVVTKPGIVTSVVETAECLLDQRHLGAAELASRPDEAPAAP